MDELKQAIGELKRHIKEGRLSGREFANAIVATFEAIEKRLPPVGEKA